MDYFILSQDSRIANPISASLTYEDITGGQPVVKIMNSVNKEAAVIQLERVDYLSKPCPIFSDALAKLMRKYDNYLELQSLTLVDQATGEQLQYWILKKEEWECLSEETEYNAEKAIKRPVVKNSALNNRKIINVKTHREPPQNAYVALNRMGRALLLIRLDLAESILRRPFIGLMLDKAEQSEE